MEILRRGIPIQCAPAPVSTNGAIADNTLAVARAASISELSDWIGDYGFNARDVKLVVGHDGSVRCIAQQFIKPDVCIMVLPTALSITANSLKEELFSSNPQAWNALVERIRVFEQEFEWTENNYMRKDWFSDTLVFALRIFCGLWKIREAEAGDSELSLTLKTLQRYWKSVPSKSNDILFGWSEEELRYLRETSIYQGLDDSRRLGQEVFHHVITPFVSSFPDWFGPRIEFAEFVHICSVISTRSFGSNDDEDCTKLHPIIDLVRGKPDQSHNCVLEGLSVRGTRLRSLKVISPINAGDEVLLEYSQTGNGDYLYAYNYLPLDRNIILNNPKTIITFDMSQYFDKMLMEIHPHAPDIREAKRAHIHGGTGMPNVLFISQEELKTHKLQYLRQVLIFLQSDEATMRKTIETQRLKSRVNSQVLFSSFVRLIEFQMGIPDLQEFRRLVSEPEAFTDNMRSALYLQMSERVLVERFINEFIELFDDIQYPNAISIMAKHMIADEIADIITELERPAVAQRASQCMFCGATDNIFRCSRCQNAFYCGTTCQQAHWKLVHKRVCELPPPPIPSIPDT